MVTVINALFIVVVVIVIMMVALGTLLLHDIEKIADRIIEELSKGEDYDDTEGVS